ncbi:MAG: hypothetical protein AAF567_15205 [Actinomycetota bacterium]
MAWLDRLDLPETTLGESAPGESIWGSNVWASAIFTVFAVLAAIFPGPLRIPFAVFSCVLFAIGTLAFLAAYGQAIGRSRTDAITIGGIYGLSGSAPKGVQRRFHLMTAFQTVVAVTTAAMRPFTAQAFGILVPMLGLGLGGLWAARHGVFGPRDDPRDRARAQVKESFNE